MDPQPPDDSPVLPATEEPTVPPRGIGETASPRLVGTLGLVSGVVMVLVFMGTHAEPPRQTSRPESTQVAAPTAVVADSAPPPTWTGRRQAALAADGSKTIAFELVAARDVPAYMSRARPVLGVRCLSRRTEAFVIPGTSVDFEGLSETRTVEIQLDNEPVTAQPWELSDSGQELFAPDGVAFVRSVARAKRLRLGFKPFRAEPVTAEFIVDGFDQLAGLVAKACGWQFQTPAQSARLD